MKKHYSRSKYFTDKYVHDSMLSSKSVLGMVKMEMSGLILEEIIDQGTDHFTLNIDFQIDRDDDNFLTRVILRAIVTIEDKE